MEIIEFITGYKKSQWLSTVALTGIIQRVTVGGLLYDRSRGENPG